MTQWGQRLKLFFPSIIYRILAVLKKKLSAAAKASETNIKTYKTKIK